MDVGAAQAFIREEQVSLWHELGDAQRSALNGTWSMKCTWLIKRIIDAAKIVGPTPSGRIEIPMLYSGFYYKICELGGFEVPPMDDDLRAVCKRWILSQGQGTLAIEQRYGATMQYLDTHREELLRDLEDT